ncbi:5-oxoprolinase subunit PxpB [Pueribacillus sp. YX66]|uniref:5-oxoprolinase subunit PxpB n=1 Tax=Pueribacillus sp. YX66 TaxID=3229242 RepID=UPI00358D422F
MENKFSPFGDCGIRISFGNELSPALNRKLMNLKERIEARKINEVTDIIPSYTTLSIFYDAFKTTYSDMCTKLEKILAEENESVTNTPLIYHIPTCYEFPFNLDLDDVARINRLSTEEVISIHSGEQYYIYMLGFLPGFPYLGGMDARIATPRLSSPRLNVPPGSVGIAGEQTGIYPLQSPGGWRIIGKTPLRLYDSSNDPTILLSAGNYVRFYPVSFQEYNEIEQEVKSGTFRIKTTVYKGETNVAN